jgi:hypothetical protein
MPHATSKRRFSAACEHRKAQNRCTQNVTDVHYDATESIVFLQQRLLSAFAHNKLAVGFQRKEWKRKSHGIRDVNEYARVPGIAGCQTRMLAGHNCSSNTVTTCPCGTCAHACYWVYCSHGWPNYVQCPERIDHIHTHTKIQ